MNINDTEINAKVKIKYLNKFNYENQQAITSNGEF